MKSDDGANSSTPLHQHGLNVLSRYTSSMSLKARVTARQGQTFGKPSTLFER
jgi:hypothetical protein